MIYDSQLLNFLIFAVLNLKLSINSHKFWVFGKWNNLNFANILFLTSRSILESENLSSIASRKRLSLNCLSTKVNLQGKVSLWQGASFAAIIEFSIV